MSLARSLSCKFVPKVIYFVAPTIFEATSFAHGEAWALLKVYTWSATLVLIPPLPSLNLSRHACMLHEFAYRHRNPFVYTVLGLTQELYLPFWCYYCYAMTAFTIF